MSAKGSWICLCSAALLTAVLGANLNAQSFLSELKLEHDPARRSEKALTFADEAFDNARSFYSKGDIHKGDAQLDDMTSALKECLSSLVEVNRGNRFKKAEIRVANLQRRLQSMVEDLSVDERGWAEFTARKLDEIHDHLLAGVMKK
jgi:hypothetical protein